MSEIERTSLDAHVSICELRYQALNDRLDRVEADLGELKTLIQNLSQDLQSQRDDQGNYWSRVQWAVIGGLIAFAGWSLNHWLV
jgi:predicted  nucleic acid-binding Zn-ribbon protein